MTAALRFLTRHGPSILALGVGLGLAWPALAALAKPAMPATVFVFVLGTLLRVDMGAVAKNLKRVRFVLLMPLFAIVLCPIAIGWVARASGLDPELQLALVVAFSAPPSSGTAAVARMLGFEPEVPLVVTLASMALTPVTAPLLAAAFGGHGHAIDPLGLALRLAVLVGGAEGVAILLRRFAAGVLARYDLVVDAVIVVALLVFALATMAGVRAMIAGHPALALQAIGLAFGFNVGLQVLAAAIFPGDLRARFNTGLIAGNRNVGLLWSALGSAATPTMALYFACTQLPIYTLPRLIQLFVARIGPAEAKPAGRSAGAPAGDRRSGARLSRR